jgi:threonine dehydratase
MDADTTPLPTRADVAAAMQRIRGDVRHTPLWRLPARAHGLGDFDLWLKLEHLQVSGSFKARGMFNRLRAHEAELRAGAQAASGVIVASGGNAGIAVATAARALGVRCEVFVPEVSAPAKRAALAALGAEVHVQGAVYADALAAASARQARTGALWMHAYDQPEVVAGAGTLLEEVQAEAGALPQRVLASVGGGGLVAGLAVAADGRTLVQALEPERAPTLHAALAAGGPVDVEVGGIAADALGARRVGAIAFGVARRFGVASVLLADDAIRDGQRWLWRECRLAVEPAAALPIAALRAGAVAPARGEAVLVVVCGANVDPAALAA